MRLFSISPAAIIHLFALAHALVVIVSQCVNYIDDVPLTILTVALIVILSLRRRLQSEIIATLTMAGCFFGYLLGNYGARLVSLLVPQETLAAAITTIIVTELIGWAVYGFGSMRNLASNNQFRWSPSVFQVLLFATAILLLRISYTLLFSNSYFASEGIHVEIQRSFSNVFAVMLLLCGDIIFVNLCSRLFRSSVVKSVVTMLFALLFSVVVTLMAYYNIPTGNNAAFEAFSFLKLYAVILLFNIVIITMFKLAAYITTSRAALRSERGERRMAQYQYNRLKLQINPHFLFNSLNILDFLVQEGETERASSFIRKLAGTYRYMLQNEDKIVVPLQEEMDFAKKYIDLLRERFTTGFTVKFSVLREALHGHVVPCCLQLLIENATKHNVVSPEHPLTVEVRVEEDWLVVSNNLQPRISQQACNGMGLKNIRQQYLDISEKEIEVLQTETEFIVKLPLL
ncbi:sensor histidine kinase [Alistipes sp.]|uniref:sensor histidine kinase n=1 Tax=Alistipes sp. TaxID=1872444 RepID=UPI0025C24FCB|nr:sensor histidine kinase [Alistipes sp.]